MSSIYIAALVAVIANIAPYFGFEVGDSVALTIFLTNALNVVIAVFIGVRRVQHGDINWLGIKKY